MKRRTALKGLAAAIAGATAIPAAQIAAAPKSLANNDDAIKAVVDEWLSLVAAMDDKTISDSESDVLFWKSAEIERRLPLIPADSLEGVAHKLRWMDHEQNYDNQDGYTPGDVFRSILADVKRLTA